MTDPTIQRPEDGVISNTPSVMDVSKVERIIANADDSLASVGGGPSFLPDTDRANAEYLDDGSNITLRTHEEESDQLCYSEDGSSEYHESKSSTPVPRHQGVTDQSYLSDADEVIDGSGSYDSDSDALTQGNHHVIDQYSFLSDADRSGRFEANPEASTPNSQQTKNHYSFLPDASTINDDTIIKMESSQEPTAELLSVTTGSSEVHDAGHPTSSDHSEIVGPSKILLKSEKEHFLTIAWILTDNLFFRQDDGTFLAIRIPSTQGRDLLRLLCGLIAQIGTPTHQITPPVGLSSAHTVDEDLSIEAQTLSLVDDKSTALPSSTRDLQAPAKASIESDVDCSSGNFSTAAWMDAIFSSADGNSYDRDWMKTHNVNDDILKGTPSKHKLDMLVRHGAVVVGDKLRVTYRSSGNPVIEEGEVRVQHQLSQ